VKKLPFLPRLFPAQKLPALIAAGLTISPFPWTLCAQDGEKMAGGVKGSGSVVAIFGPFHR